LCAELLVTLAERIGKVYLTDSNVDGNLKIPLRVSQNPRVEVIPNTAGNLLPSGSFDAVVAMWDLHHADDLDKSLREMARMVGTASPNAQIIIVQAAPDNELVNIINTVCLL
jgi:ubiquinone/menaquinone biosynthesis C-methylase UbiE